MGSIVDSVMSFFGHDSQKTNAQKGVSDFQNASNQAQQLYSPYISGGADAFGRANAMMTPGYQYSPSDPSYQWRYQQGLDAANAGASAAGSLNSGGQLKALQQYGQGLASTEFSNDFNRNNTLANYGLQAANGETNALFNGARGTAQYRGDQGKATEAQWGDGGNLINSVGRFFGI